MSALLPSSTLQLVTDRYQFGAERAQPVTDRNQLDGRRGRLVTVCHQLADKLVTNCNQLDRGAGDIRERPPVAATGTRKPAATPSGSNAPLVPIQQAATTSWSNARPDVAGLTPKGSQPIAQERPNTATTPKGSQPVLTTYTDNRVHPLISGFTLAWTFAFLLGACQSATSPKATEPREIHTADYDLVIPAEQKALLILFPCFGCDAADTRSESPITDTAAANGIAVLMMNFNRHLLMSDAEKREVLDVIAGAVKEHGIDATNTFIGGFSSGGNVSVLLAKELVRAPRSGIGPKGVFAVDSPLDLVHLYDCSKRDLTKTTFPEYKDEARMVVALLDSTLGSPTDSMPNYQRSAPLLNTAASAAPLKDLPVRFYTEPDTGWWRANRDDSYEELNAYALKRIHDTLAAVGNARAEYITTEGRGVQHGNRHPHAWSIVDEQELVKWIKSLSTP